MSETQQRPGEAEAGPEVAAPAERGGASRTTAVAAAFFFLIIVLTIADIVGDVVVGAGAPHLVAETIVAALSLGGLVTMWGLIREARRRAQDLEVALDHTRADLARWRGEAQELLKGLGAAIDRQFDRWGLSPAEREVGLLLLKGLSLKDAAEARRTSERTVRQQALAVYRKAGLAGRAELAAFFLEDLLLPRTEGAAEKPAAAPVAPAPTRG